MKLGTALALSAGVGVIIPGCSDYRRGRHVAPVETQVARLPPTAPANATAQRFLTMDPTLSKFFEKSHAYAVFPSIGKGALVVGGAHGNGEVFEKDQLVGTVEMTQISVGAQIGGQIYSEIIFFRDQATFDVFRMNQFEFTANLSAVAAASGRGKASDFDHGVAVFVLPREGLMAEAAVGGQKFTYRPLPTNQAN